MREVIYQATRGAVCAGWVEVDGLVVECAPILRRWSGRGMLGALQRAGFRVVTVRTLTAAPETR